MGQFDGKVALVTGGNTGMGQAAALKFAEHGAKVVVAARREREGNETVKLIEKSGGEAIFVRVDVSIAADVEAMVAKTLESFGRLDYAFNNAGINPTRKPLHEQTEDDWHTYIDPNLKGVWLCMKYEITQMLTNGGGAIVNNSSIAGVVGVQGAAHYAASKYGVIGLTTSAALDYAKDGIRINAVCPGVIRVQRNDERFTNNPDQLAAMEAVTPMGRIGTANEVAEAVIWLCSDSSSFVTGHAMAIDGGYTTQ